MAVADATVTVAPSASTGELLEALDTLIDLVVARDVTGLDTRELNAEVESTERGSRRLTARRTNLALEMARRAREAAREHRPGDRRAQEAAEREVQRKIADRLQLPPGEVRRASRTRRQLDSLPDTSKAHDNGDITAAHAKVIADTVEDLDGDLRERIAAELTDAARSMDPVELGKRARQLLAQLAPEVFERHGRDRHQRRTGRLSTSPDGMLELHLRCSGIDAEVTATAVHAFRRPDRAGETLRTSEQATADAIVDALKAGLEASEAPTDHGVRPHVSLVLYGTHRPDGPARRSDPQDIVGSAAQPPDGHGAGRDATGSEPEAADPGPNPHDPHAERHGFESRAAGGQAPLVAIGSWIGTIPYDELARLLPTATITRILADEAGRPLDVTDTSRACPTRIWRGLTVRDRTCRWPGCDIPAAWCQAAHGATPWRQQRRWNLDDTCLLCTRHHRKVDNDGWKIEVKPDSSIHFHPPDAGQPLISHPPPI